ncbi:MAG: bifunctional riboflavin kinase/FAD synthetase [Thermodesulfobacteriota bacterium]|nr:bifunctional riboflavin kinase/FAD synthetase [Thermodesulfobacteriota bacterium]
MPVIRAIDDLNQQYPHPVLTIGNFDGVHLGHRALFNMVKEWAAKAGGTSMVLTFEPHPIRVLTEQKGPPLITMYNQKMELIEALGIDVVICLDFTIEFAKMEPEDFVRDLLVQRIGVKEIVIGYDYRFGRKGRGNRDLLIAMGKELGFSVHTLGPEPGPDGGIISSTRIRELVMAGDVEKAPSLLGRKYRIAGRVVRGRDRGGRLLGFPTANLRLVDELIPKMGVYAVRVVLDDQTYDGVANIGHNPTFGDVALSVEVHCFDMEADLYGRTIKVDFIKRIRDEKKFSGPEELASQITADCKLARRILS